MNAALLKSMTGIDVEAMQKEASDFMETMKSGLAAYDAKIEALSAQMASINIRIGSIIERLDRIGELVDAIASGEKHG